MTNSRRHCRNGKPCEPRSIQESIYCCVSHSNVDSGSIAEMLGVRRGYLLDAANPDREEVQFQARLLVPLMAVTGNLTPLRFLARNFDVAVIDLPRRSASDDDLRKSFMAAVKELGEASGVIEAVLSDGIVSRDDAQRVRRELAETIEALVLVQASFDARVKGNVA